MNPVPVLRPYRSLDQEAILNLFLSNTPEFFHPREYDDLMGFLAGSEVSTFYVVERAKEIVACGGYLIKDQKALLTWFIVDPGSHGMGLGKLLIDHHLEALKVAGVNLVEVRTSQLAYRFFEKFGFRLMFTKPDYWGPAMHLYQLEREISNLSIHIDATNR